MDRFGRNSTTVENGHEPTVTHLVSGIVSDIGQLLEQQMQLLRTEIQNNVRRTRAAALLSAIGAGTLALAGIALVFALGFGLNAAFENLPLWACFACVCAALCLAGGVILYASKEKWLAVHPFPEESAQALKENLQCMNPIRKS